MKSLQHKQGERTRATWTVHTSLVVQFVRRTLEFNKKNNFKKRLPGRLLLSCRQLRWWDLQGKIRGYLWRSFRSENESFWISNFSLGLFRPIWKISLLAPTLPSDIEFGMAANDTESQPFWLMVDDTPDKKKKKLEKVSPWNHFDFTTWHVYHE